jgi:hypothetical protein
VRQSLQATHADVLFHEITSYIGNKLFCENVMGFRHIDTHDMVMVALRYAFLTPSGVYRRSAVLKIGGYRESLIYSEDFDFHVRLVSQEGLRFAIIPEPLAVIRLRQEGRTYKNEIDSFAGGIEAMRLLSKELPEKYHVELAERAVSVGRKLFNLGARDKAAEAFLLAERIGPPTFKYFNAFYRISALCIGALNTERIAHLYRALMRRKTKDIFLQKE